MYALIVLSVAIAAASAATPFFESPHNEKASAFYKTPSHGQHPGPVVHTPSAAPVYRPAQPAYRPAQPSYRPPQQSYNSAPSYGSHGNGATSFQNVQLSNSHY